jgi:hypothetical protein
LQCLLESFTCTSNTSYAESRKKERKGKGREAVMIAVSAEGNEEKGPNETTAKTLAPPLKYSLCGLA